MKPGQTLYASFCAASPSKIERGSWETLDADIQAFWARVEDKTTHRLRDLLSQRERKLETMCGYASRLEGQNAVLRLGLK